MSDQDAPGSRRQLTPPAPGTWNVDQAHTNVGFVARYMMITKVRGQFNEFEGAVHVAGRPEDSWAELTVQAASIDTNQPDRDGHLRSADFLDVERFPTLAFRSTEVVRTGTASLRVGGDLTIRGVTNPVELEVEYLGSGMDPYGRERVSFSVTGQIDRDEYGASWNQALETGGWLVGKIVKLEIEAQAIRAAG